MKISDTYQQINGKSELSKVKLPERLAGRKKIEQSKNFDTVTDHVAIKTDTVQLSRESLDLANSVKTESDNKEAPVQKTVNEDVLVELLKKADKQSGIFGLSEGISKIIEQENSDSNSGGKIEFLL